MKKILVTGGSGFIGYHLSLHYANSGASVTIIDNLERGKFDADFQELVSRDNVRFINSDITEYKAFDEVGEGYDYIVHMAAINGTENFYNKPDKVFKVGVLGIINLLDWYVESSSKAKIVFTSSSEVYAGALSLLGDKFPIPTPENVPLVIEDSSNVRWSYGGGKLAGEIALFSYAKSYNIKFSILRYHNIYGPRMGNEHVVPQFIARVINQINPFPIYGGNETRTFCYIDDAIDGTKLILESDQSDGQIIHVGRDDEEIKIVDLAKKLFSISGNNPSIDIKSAPSGSVMRRCPDINKLRNMGYGPKVNLVNGLTKTLKWYIGDNEL
jgi:nucleoside-diphosphate-sugar epimerase